MSGFILVLKHDRLDPYVYSERDGRWHSEERVPKVFKTLQNAEAKAEEILGAITGNMSIKIMSTCKEYKLTYTENRHIEVCP